MANEDERKCKHGYGIKQGPCGICDAPRDILLWKFAKFVLGELEVDYSAYMRKYDLLWVDDEEMPQWLVEAFERQEHAR